MDKRTQGKISGYHQRRRSVRNYLVAAAGVILLVACDSSRKKEEREVLVSVYGDQLYVDEIYQILPESYTVEDSAQIVESYVNNWIRDRVMLNRAEKALTKEEMDVKDKLEAYRNSLVIYEFEKKWVQSNLDTVVSDQELREYYEKNKEAFELDDYLVKAVFVKVRAAGPDRSRIEQLYTSRDSANLVELEKLCRSSAENYYLDAESWLYFDEIVKLVPEEMIYNKENFVINRKNRRYQLNDYVYLLNVVDYRFGISPFEFEVENIRSRIIQQRTSELRRKLREDLLNKAYNEEKINRYDL